MHSVIVVLCAFAAVASAGGLYGIGLTNPLAYSVPIAAPLGYSAPLAPIAYSAPLAYAAAPAAVVAAPAVQSGYVAATRGAVHTAPLPEGPNAFSHHINTAPAPGTL